MCYAFWGWPMATTQKVQGRFSVQCKTISQLMIYIWFCPQAIWYEVAMRYGIFSEGTTKRAIKAWYYLYRLLLLKWGRVHIDFTSGLAGVGVHPGWLCPWFRFTCADFVFACRIVKVLSLSFWGFSTFQSVNKVWGVGKSASSSSVCRKRLKQANLVTNISIPKFCGFSSNMSAFAS